MTRRALLPVFAAALLRADSGQDAWAVLSAAASALSADNAAGFLSYFDADMAGYERLRSDVAALLRVAQVGSSIELTANEGDDRSRTLKVDWLLNVVARQDSVTSTRREGAVTCRVEKQGKKWRITGIEPIGFFAPGGPTR